MTSTDLWTITIEEARKFLPERLQKLTDEEIQKVLDFFYAFWHIMIDNILYKNKKKTIENTN